MSFPSVFGTYKYSLMPGFTVGDVVDFVNSYIKSEVVRAYVAVEHKNMPKVTEVAVTLEITSEADVEPYFFSIPIRDESIENDSNNLIKLLHSGVLELATRAYLNMEMWK